MSNKGEKIELCQSCQAAVRSAAPAHTPVNHRETHDTHNHKGDKDDRGRIGQGTDVTPTVDIELRYRRLSRHYSGAVSLRGLMRLRLTSLLVEHHG